MKKTINLKSLRHAQYLVAQHDYPYGIGETFYRDDQEYNYPKSTQGFVDDRMFDKYALTDGNRDFIEAQKNFENNPQYETALEFWARLQRYSQYIVRNNIADDIVYINKEIEYDFEIN
jgi:hypothetical protein